MDLLNQRFGRLVVLEETEQRNTKRFWICRCDCGKVKVISQYLLTSKQAQSCGCYQKEATRARFTTHGMTKTPEHVAWSAMKQRCTYLKHKDYARYGGRGIKICERWLNSFENFFQDMGYKPSAQHSVDRIDSNKDYAPGNCRWAVPEVQQKNRRSNHYISFNGENLTLSDWARKLGLKQATLSARINGQGWSIEKALSTYPKKAAS